MSCHGYFYETHGTILHGKRSSPERIVRVIACLAAGLGIRGTARGLEIDPNTVLQWLVQAAELLRAFSQYCLRDLHLTQGQLDALYAVRSAVKDGASSEDDAGERRSRSPPWVWTAMDPESKLLLAVDVGERTLAMGEEEAWCRGRAGDGTTGPRWYDGRWLPFAAPLQPHGRRWLVVRRRLSDPTERTASVVCAPETPTLATALQVVGRRWTIAQCCEEAKGAGGRDQDEVRSWTGWSRPLTWAMGAYALLTVVRAVPLPAAPP